MVSTTLYVGMYMYCVAHRTDELILSKTVRRCCCCFSRLYDCVVCNQLQQNFRIEQKKNFTSFKVCIKSRLLRCVTFSQIRSFVSSFSRSFVWFVKKKLFTLYCIVWCLNECLCIYSGLYILLILIRIYQIVCRPSEQTLRS